MVVNALAFLHSRGIVHMDVKPSNILIDHEGGWHLGDFDSCCFYDYHNYSPQLRAAGGVSFKTFA